MRIYKRYIDRDGEEFVGRVTLNEDTVFVTSKLKDSAIVLEKLIDYIKKDLSPIKESVKG